jgi:hypothetical protein
VGQHPKVFAAAEGLVESEAKVNIVEVAAASVEACIGATEAPAHIASSLADTFDLELPGHRVGATDSRSAEVVPAAEPSAATA